MSVQEEIVNSLSAPTCADAHPAEIFVLPGRHFLQGAETSKISLITDTGCTATNAKVSGQGPAPGPYQRVNSILQQA